MTMTVAIRTLLLAALCAIADGAFVIPAGTAAQRTCTHLSAHSQAANGGRREIMRAASATFFAVGSTMALSPKPAPVLAIEDLDMPAVPEPTKLDEDAMAERLRRKAELQQKMVAPKTIGESFQNERTKQKEMSSQTKEQRRNAMCEELGRGC